MSTEKLLCYLLNCSKVLVLTKTNAVMYTQSAYSTNDSPEKQPRLSNTMPHAIILSYGYLHFLAGADNT
jgi:hypothetical protein